MAPIARCRSTWSVITSVAIASTIGTANFDPRSFKLNFELALLVEDRALARRLEEEMLDNIASATEVRADDPKPPFVRRLGEAWARLLSPLL